jgi:hypothetical protein
MFIVDFSNEIFLLMDARQLIKFSVLLFANLMGINGLIIVITIIISYE